MSMVYIALRAATTKRKEHVVAIETTAAEIQSAITQAAFRATIQHRGDATKHKAAMDRWARGVDIEVYPPSFEGPWPLPSGRAQA